MAAAEEALRLVRVDYRPRPFVVDLDQAERPRMAYTLTEGSPRSKRTCPGGDPAVVIRIESSGPAHFEANFERIWRP